MLALQEGYQWRLEQGRARDAWVLANLLQPHSKRRLRAADFLPGAESPAANHEQFFRDIGEPDEE